MRDDGVVTDSAAQTASAPAPGPVRVPLVVLAARRPSVLARVLPVVREAPPVEVAAFNSSI